jgi:uncharacterized protein YbjT (DUF2867 family)
MKLVIFGAAGRIGRRILHEALARGHAVTAVVRDPARLEVMHAALSIVVADVSRADEVARTASGHDAAVNAIGPGQSGEVGVIVAAARALVAGLAPAGPQPDFDGGLRRGAARRVGAAAPPARALHGGRLIGRHRQALSQIGRTSIMSYCGGTKPCTFSLVAPR